MTKHKKNVLLIVFICAFMLINGGCGVIDSVDDTAVISETVSSETDYTGTILRDNGYMLETGDKWVIADDKIGNDSSCTEHTFILSDISDAEDVHTVIVFQIIDSPDYSSSAELGYNLSGQYKDSGSLVISEGECAVNNYSGYEIVCEMTVDSAQTMLKSRHLIIQYDNRLYSFILAALPEKYDNAVIMMNEMLASFVIE